MKRLTRGQAIRQKCLDCCCGLSAEVRRCNIIGCPLFRYRMGREMDETILDDKNIDENEKIKKM